jgi:hypothetical protein
VLDPTLNDAISACIGFFFAYIFSLSASYTKGVLSTSEPRSHLPRGPLWLVLASLYLLVAFIVGGELFTAFSAEPGFLLIGLVGGIAFEVVLFQLARRGKLSIEKDTPIDRFVLPEQRTSSPSDEDNGLEVDHGD